MRNERTDFVEVQEQGGRTRRIHLSKAHLQVGRATSCDIWLPAASVSRRHARMECPAEGIWRIVDLGSTNGTFVNGKRVELANLFDGDVIGIGDFRMTLRVGKETASRMADLELDIAMKDTAPVVVHSDEMPRAGVLPMRTLTELHDAMRRLSQATTVGALLSIVAEEFREALKPDRIAVGLKREGHHAWPVIVNAQGKPADGTDLPHRLVPKVNALRDSRPFNWKTLGKTRASSWSGGRAAGRRCFIFPIKAGGLSLGHVYAESRRPEWSPLPETIQFLALLTNQAGILLEKLQLLEDQQRMQEVQLEVSRARSVQIQLLPAALVLDPRIDIAARNHPAFTISGDFYDCQSPSPGKVAFIVADVMGHGMSAALMMTRLQAVFQMGVRRGFQLPDVDMRLDEVMQVAGSKVIFASGILGLCDLEKNVLSIASAGHQWPSIFCGEERIEMPDSACAIGWGMPRERQPVQPLTVPLRGRWSLLAHTDGITEAKNAKGAAYSIERLADLHWRHLGLSADEMCDAILDDVLAHTDPSVPVADDMTLFAMCSKK